ncbi:MAG TPA: DUF2818 family protein [Pararobbsia sp.]|jgi:hypothetical protein|nr:DUF2818 family protein [Pararobbsia sp.]
MSAAGWFIVLLAVVFANLPFVNQRLLCVIPLKGGRKRTWWRLAELVIFYFIIGAVGRALEAQAGNLFPQEWQFYAITACLFLVFAFPGYTVRYLVKFR